MESSADRTTKHQKLKKKRVAIIGAGPSGLCMVKHLADDPDTFDPVVFERGSSVGGIWKYKENDGPVWKEMFANIPRVLMSFGNFENHHEETFQHNTNILAYINDFTRTFDLKKYVKFNMSVTAVEILKEDDVERWRVTCYNVNNKEYMLPEEFDAVVVCNGTVDKVYIPAVEGIEEFKGPVIHSREFRLSDSYKGKNVLLIGTSLSGLELSFVLANVAEKIYWSIKKPLTAALPRNVYGMPSVQRITESTVIFMDGIAEHIDAIVFCTGYQFSFPFLSNEIIHIDKTNRVMPLYKHILNIEHQTIIFLKIPQHIVAFKAIFKHAQFAAAVISGKATLPPKRDMYEDAEQNYQDRRSKGFTAHNCVDNYQWDLIRDLSAMAGFEPYPKVYDKLWDYVVNSTFTNFQNFKKKKYRITGPETYEVLC